MLKSLALATMALAFSASSLHAQTKTNREVLQQIAADQKQKNQKAFEQLKSLAKQKGWALTYTYPDGRIAHLASVDEKGFPIYLTTMNNTDASATLGTNQLYAGGSLGLNLSGSSTNVKGKMGIWDGGRVLGTHVELNGRVIQRDNPASLSDHATHVAGTMMAAGINPAAKGMAFGFQELIAYDFAGNSDQAEIPVEASNLLVSNHSYGTVAGWNQNPTQGNRWEFNGRPNENEDWKFGAYANVSQLYDSIAYNAPFYLMVFAAGNARNNNGPAVGANYFRPDANGVMSSAGPRPASISSNDSYEIIPMSATSKNTLTVGAITGIPGGYFSPADAVMSGFSCWGPTDDGRIKPDIVADGVSLLSTFSTSDNSYSSISGTSMASPSVTGSLLLLQEYYSQLNNGNFMRSATLKGLVIHTANEAGPSAGPDYQNGWGVANIGRAAAMIKDRNNTGNLILENNLVNGNTYTLNLVASGNGPLKATICWTDPRGVVDAGNPLNSTNLRLIHDLDMRIEQGTTVFQPWILNPASPSAAATRGDNFRDNVEQVLIENPIPGMTYTIRVTHKSTLQRGQQAFSLIVSGAGGSAYCTSAATANGGTRIDSVAFAGIQRNNPTGCTTYTNFAGTTPGNVQPGQTLPITVKVGSCDATITDKVVKVYIDANNNGSFTDAGELLVTSSVINGNGTFTGSISLPATLIPGNTILMRIVAQQTNVTTDVNPCGTYTNGETQDFRLVVNSPTNDVGLLDVIMPMSGACASPVQMATIRVRNNGQSDVSNFPVTFTLRDGATTVANITTTFPLTVAPGTNASSTLQVPFTTVAGKNYSVNAFIQVSGDQMRVNDTLNTTLSIANAPAAPNGGAEICGTNALLRVAAPNNNLNYYWYRNATTDSSIAFGSSASTTVIPPANTYFVGTGNQSNLGLRNKETYPNSGSYFTGTAYINYTATVPVVLENARLYTKWPGVIRFIVADVTPGTGGSFSYIPLSTVDIEVPATSTSPASGAQPNDPSDNGAVVNLNLQLPAGSHSIIVQTQGLANLYRNNNITASGLYPFTLPNVFSMTTHSAAVTTPSSLDQFYYFLYDMRIRTLDCVSPRTPVVAATIPTPVITQSGDSLVSNLTIGNQWLLNGAPISGATGGSFKPSQNGNYSVIIAGTLGCLQTSNVINFTTTSVTNLPPAEIGLKVSPNPSQGQFNIQFRVNNRADLSLELVNTSGQVVYSKQVPKFVGTYTENFNRKSMASGVYVFRVQHGDKAYNQKIIIQ